MKQTFTIPFKTVLQFMWDNYPKMRKVILKNHPTFKPAK